MRVGIRQQRQIPRSFDRDRQLALIARAGAGDAARHDLAGLGDVLLQQFEILVVDLFDAFRGEAAELLAAELTRHAHFCSPTASPSSAGALSGSARRAASSSSR